MNYSDIVRLTSGLLQFGIACYALKLGCRFNAIRVGWLLFSGLSMLAVVYLLLPIIPFPGSIQLAVKADIIYGLISILLLAGLVHLDVKSKKRMLAEIAITMPSSEADSALEEKVNELTKANEELQQTAARLQSELAQRMQAEDRAEKSYSESQQHTTELLKANEELRQTITALQAQVIEQQNAQAGAEQAHNDALAASKQAGLAQIAAITGSVLHNLNDVLAGVNSARVAADHLARARVATVVRLSRAIETDPVHNGQNSNPITLRSRTSQAKRSPRRHAKIAWKPSVEQPRPPLAGNLSRIARQLSVEQALLKRKIDSVKKRLELLKASLAPRQTEDKIYQAIDRDTIPALVEDASLAQTEESVSRPDEGQPGISADPQEHFISAT